ncbi:MAG TPA: hypothetical protein VLF68_00665 [Candidatus Saccharimonadales bacterium]|nr:hypothetical protein [Candidatus Saccharimonadales bacterium]
MTKEKKYFTISLILYLLFFLSRKSEQIKGGEQNGKEKEKEEEIIGK